eukprot:scaffold447_cov307-Pinguiococcus_pyrenoidosus.AAC.27
MLIVEVRAAGTLSSRYRVTKCRPGAHFVGFDQVHDVILLIARTGISRARGVERAIAPTAAVPPRRPERPRQCPPRSPWQPRAPGTSSPRPCSGCSSRPTTTETALTHPLRLHSECVASCLAARFHKTVALVCDQRPPCPPSRAGGRRSRPSPTRQSGTEACAGAGRR